MHHRPCHRQTSPVSIVKPNPAQELPLHQLKPHVHVAHVEAEVEAVDQLHQFGDEHKKTKSPPAQHVVGILIFTVEDHNVVLVLFVVVAGVAIAVVADVHD